MNRDMINKIKLDVSLEGLEVGLSGAIPEREKWSEPAMDRGILEFISLFSGLVFKYGGRVIHGCHPSFTPIILKQARLHAGKRSKPPVTLVMSELWLSSYSSEEILKMIDVSELIITKKVGSGDLSDINVRNNSLTAMRKVLIASQNLMVLVGGKMHDKDGMTPGVGEELHFANVRKIPSYLIGGLGGYAHEMAKELIPSSLHNSLSDEKNVELFGTNDVSSCVNIVFENLCQRFWNESDLGLSAVSLGDVNSLIKEIKFADICDGYFNG